MKHYLLLALLSLLTFPLSAVAQDTGDQTQWYQVELIVFEYKGSHSVSEARSADEPLPDTAQTQELIPQGALDEYVAFNANSRAGEQPYVILPNTALSLDAAAAKLNNSARHRVLFHVAWRQPVAAPELARGVHIHSNMNNDALYIAKLAAQRADTSPDAQAQRLPLDGRVRVSVSRFLHLNVDLTFTRKEAFTPQELEKAAADHPRHTLRTYRLVEERRMKSKEIHYFDHPAFGVVATITPYKPGS